MPSSRILIVTSYFFPDKANGQSRIAYDLARAYLALGCEVWFLAQAVGKHSPPYQFVEHFHVIRYFLERSALFDFNRHVKHIFTAEKALSEFFPGLPDIVHGHDLLPYIAAVQKYDKESRFCYTIHSPAVEELDIVWKHQGFSGKIKRILGLPLVQRLERQALERSQALEAKSQYTRSLVQKHYGDSIAAKILIIPGWVDIERFRPLDKGEQISARHKLGWPTDKLILFSLRRLEPRMGLDNYLHALSIVKSRGGKFLAVIGGTGSQKDKLIRLMHSLNLSDQVRFIEHVPEEMLPLAYGACDASIVPTAALEGFGLIALEALACGKPVIATPVGALPEVVCNFRHGWLTRSSDSEALAESICALLDGGFPSNDHCEVPDRVEDYSFSTVFQVHREWLFGSIGPLAM